MGRFAVDIYIQPNPDGSRSTNVMKQGDALPPNATKVRIEGRGRFEKPPPTFSTEAEVQSWIASQRKRGLSVSNAMR